MTYVQSRLLLEVHYRERHKALDKLLNPCQPIAINSFETAYKLLWHFMTPQCSLCYS